MHNDDPSTTYKNIIEKTNEWKDTSEATIKEMLGASLADTVM